MQTKKVMLLVRFANKNTNTAKVAEMAIGLLIALNY